MYRREVFEKIGGFNETLNTQEEYEFNLRCLKAGFKIGYCDSVLAIYRRHPTQKVRVVSLAEKKEEKQRVNDMYKDVVKIDISKDEYVYVKQEIEHD